MRERRETGGISEEGREILKSIYKCQIIPLELMMGDVRSQHVKIMGARSLLRKTIKHYHKTVTHVCAIILEHFSQLITCTEVTRKCVTFTSSSYTSC